MKDNEKLQHPQHPGSILERYSNSQHLKVLDSIILKDRKNITSLK
jgi:hypothetical protein